MRKNWIGLGLALGFLAACGAKEPIDTLPVVDPASARPGAVDDALEVDQVRRDYDNCIRKLGPRDAGCQNLEAMYEDAKSRYEQSNRTRPR